MNSSAPHTRPRLVATDVTLRRGGRTLFRNLSFNLPRGTCLVIRANNGMGKTSLLRAAAGVLPLAAGRLTHDRHDTDFAFLPAADTVWQGLRPVTEVLAEWAALLGCAPRETARALAQVGLADIQDRTVAALSMGQKRRLSWARLVLRPSSLWLLDEPFNSLDRDGIAAVATLMHAHCAAGGSILAACHDDLASHLPGCACAEVAL